MGEGRSQPTPAPPRRGKAESGGMRNYRGCSRNNCSEIFLPLSAQNPDIFSLREQKPCTFLVHALANIFIYQCF
ncbi:hypothetical protein [Okeania sp. SIO2C2]|uniref:hypothetical protein n=1 Tax=Okeania sp. SIO2C2 TaxID=2607787 RepID=UPI00257ED176|nr:hypothetical protein [Okeania sp. SIO2C2]